MISQSKKTQTLYLKKNPKDALKVGCPNGAKAQQPLGTSTKLSHCHTIQCRTNTTYTTHRHANTI